jgi:hypothetical protein
MLGGGGGTAGPGGPAQTWRSAPLILMLVVAVGCGKKEEKEAEAVAPVQTAEVRRDSIRRVIEADGILYPRNQASVVPKISAPVRATFYVNRGDRVRAGQLLALLENRDLAAAAEESKGQYDQAEANYRSTTAAAVPEQMVKAQTDQQAAGRPSNRGDLRHRHAQDRDWRARRRQGAGGERVEGGRPGGDGRRPGAGGRRPCAGRTSGEGTPMNGGEHWTARHAKPVIFVIVTLVGVISGVHDSGGGISVDGFSAHRGRRR